MGGASFFLLSILFVLRRTSKYGSDVTMVVMATTSGRASGVTIAGVVRGVSSGTDSSLRFGGSGSGWGGTAGGRLA